MFKSARSFRKTHFHLKVNKSRRRHNLGPGQIPWGNLRGNRSCWGSFLSFFFFFFIFFLIKKKNIYFSVQIQRERFVIWNHLLQ